MTGSIAAALAARRRVESEFLAAMSHEIRTPIHGVIGLAGLLAPARLSDQERGYLQMIGQCARSLLTLVDNVLDYSQLEAGHLRLEEAEVDLHGLLREVTQEAGARAADQGLAFAVRGGDAVPSRIAGDGVRLRQILHNLLDNALKFTAHGGCTLDVRVESPDHAPRLAFAVRDTGVGIAPADQDRLFTRFCRGDHPAHQQAGGTGLGLAVSRGLARRMGGDIVLASRLGAGSTFTLLLPLRTPGAGPAAGAPAADAAILLVEDNPVNQVVACGMLACLGHRRVTLAANGLQALDACARERFDLVLMDCQMPGMDGLRATALLRERGVTTPIVALTASPVVGDRDRCLAAGMDDYLTKPVDADLLARKVAHWLQAARGTAADPPVPDFEPSTLQDRFFADAALFSECRRVFLRQAPAWLEEMAGCLDDGDAPRARFLAHSLRGSSCTIGALRLAECCRRIERCLESGAGDPAAARAHLPPARAALAGFEAASASHQPPAA